MKKVIGVFVMALFLGACASTPENGEPVVACEKYANEPNYRAGESCMQYYRREIGNFPRGADRRAY